jgi:hypothetical protein
MHDRVEAFAQQAPHAGLVQEVQLLEARTRRIASSEEFERLSKPTTSCPEFNSSNAAWLPM